MNEEINLKSLQIACYLYGKFTKEDKAYKNLFKIGNVDLTIHRHVNNLIQWLRDWGMRNFVTEYNDFSRKEIMKWYRKSISLLPKRTDHLHKASEQFFSYIPEIFDTLKNVPISFKEYKKEKKVCKVGPVGAAKILFAIRPHFFAPWDKKIYLDLGHTGNGESYRNYLLDIKNKLTILDAECRINGFSLETLCNKISRNISSLPKIIDEYYWVNITKGCKSSELLNIISSI